MELYNKENEYGSEYKNHLLEQWKTCIDMSNALSERRTNTNNYFLTVNSIILAVISFQYERKSIFIAVVGLIICLLWMITLENYKRLNSVKFKIINDIGSKLPANVFEYEWKLVGMGNEGRKYKRFSKLEKGIPIIFIVLYGIAIFYPILKEVIK